MEVGPRIDLDTRAGMIVHHVFKSQQSVHGLERIGQTIITAAEIKSLVFNACPEIPLTGDKEAMRVTKVIIERIPVAEVAVHVIEIAAERVVRLIIEEIKVVALRWRRRRLRLVSRCARKHGRGDAKEKNGQKFSDVFHGAVKAFVQWTNRISEPIPVVSEGKYFGKKYLRNFAPAGF